MEDGSFYPEPLPKGRWGKAPLAAVLMRGPFIEAVRVGEITVDGLDATEVLLELLRELRFDVVMLGGVSFAGFNLVDAWEVYRSYGRPVIVVSRKRPDNEAVKRALMRHFEDWAERWNIVRRLGKIRSVETFPGEPPIHFEVVGATAGWAERVLKGYAAVCRVPEPVRVARIVARGVSQPPGG